MNQIWVDGVAGAGLPGDDPGLLLGLTVFETIRTYKKHPFRLAAHLDRLESSAKALRISTPARATIEREIAGAIAEDVRIRYTITAGDHRIVDVAPINRAKVGGPVSVARMNWQAPDFLPSVVKHGSRAAWIVAARELDVDEVLLTDPKGFILEANRSNVFAVIDGVVRTPPVDGRFLVGVTRGALLDAAERAGVPTDTSPLPVDSNFDELYLSSTLKELAPVVRLDGKPGPGGGPVGAELLKAFHQLVHEEAIWSRAQ